MARTILTALLVVLLHVLVGCHSVDSGASQLLPPSMKAAREAIVAGKAAEMSEADVIEETAINRAAYRQALETLVEHYRQTGNNMKLAWAEDELKELEKVPQYNYIIEAGIAGPDLRASTTITEADYMYDEAVRTENQAGALLVIKDENKLRLALERYNRLISKHPNSDKIDDAAYKIGGICEYFKDYTIAVLYYQRAYQWDPDTIHPARFKAAYILDAKLHRRAEALELYQQSIVKESQYENYKEYAEKRIKEFTAGDEAEE